VLPGYAKNIYISTITDVFELYMFPIMTVENSMLKIKANKIRYM
jgi:hypothetical protein